MADSVQAESARRVSGCVTELLRKQPFFGSLALRLPLKPDPTRETLACDGREIRYSPRWVADSDAHAIEAAIARVVLACALKHHTRRDGRDPERWQHASQLVTHDLLRDAGFSLPPEAEAWDSMSVEQAYDRLPEPDENDGDGEQPSGGAGSAGVTDDSSRKSDDGQHGGASGDSARDDGQQPNGDSGRGDPERGAPRSHDPAGTGEVMDSPSAGGSTGEGSDTPDLSEADLNAEEQAWDEAMHQALSLAKAEGKLPGAVEETVRGAHLARVDWRTLLRRHMTAAARSDYSWSAPNLRFIDGGLYLPSIRSEGIDTVAVLVDTSGSLPTGILGEFWAEVREIAAELRPERVVVVQVDAAVRHAAEYAASDLPEEIAVRGRGGTDFRPGFDWLEEHGVRPGVCLYFTDMECSRYPATEPDFPVLWIDWSDPPSEPGREPWGECIRIAA